MKKILMTAFEPFGGEAVNPSFLAIQQIKAYDDVLIKKICLPVVYNLSSQIILKEMSEFKPDIILMIGQAGGRKAISLERVAINLDDSEQPDNNGVIKTESKIRVDGQDAYFSNLPLTTLKNALTQQNIPVQISLSAGSYVCNHIFYSIMHKIHNKNQVLAGFIHVPYIEEQVIDKSNIPSVKLRDIVKSLEVIIDHLK
jgi:pyroglutamyl-peptidase